MRALEARPGEGESQGPSKPKSPQKLLQGLDSSGSSEESDEEALRAVVMFLRIVVSGKWRKLAEGMKRLVREQDMVGRSVIRFSSVVERDVMQWFESVPHLLTDQEWEVRERAGLSSLSHCHCPWGGHLLKLTLSGIRVQNADTTKLLLRPETRAMHETLGGGIELLEQLAPGDAAVRRPVFWGLLQQLTGLVFGNTEAPGIGLSEVSVPIISQQTLCRAWPTNEDTTLMFSTNQCDPADALLICRPQTTDQVGLVGIFAVSAEKFDQWISTHHALWLDTALRAATQFLNRPGITELRALDANMYTVLSIHSCKRGPPLLPLAPGSTEPASVTIKTDERSQLGEWSRTPLGPDGKFRLVSLVKQF
ncbi:mucK, partial [Symbiodinium necroappetens]